MRRLSLTLAAALYATQATAGLSFRTDAPEPVDHQYWKFLVRSVAKAADAKPPQDIVAMLEQVAVVRRWRRFVAMRGQTYPTDSAWIGQRGAMAGDLEDLVDAAASGIGAPHPL